MRTFGFLLPALLLSAIGPAAGQNNNPMAPFKVEFRIRDGSDAKSARRYTMLIESTGRGTFKIGERVPVASGSFQPGVGGVGVSPMLNTQFSYVDVGVNIETKISRQDDWIAMVSTLDISTIVEHKQQAGAPAVSNPTIAQIHIALNALVPLGKPTLVASVDDPVTHQRFDVEALVTKAD